jgi:hypothetical protein
MFRKPKFRSDAALQDVIVTSDAVKRKKRLSFNRWAPRKRELPSKPVLVGIGVVAFVFIIPALYFLSLWAGDLLHHDKPTYVCSDTLIKDANQKINDNNITGMTKIAGDITKLKRHETDVNCEYILVRYAISVGNITDAREQLASLKKVYKTSYSELFTPPTLSPAELGTLIEGTATTQNIENNETVQNQEELSQHDSEADKLGPGAQ